MLVYVRIVGVHMVLGSFWRFLWNRPWGCLLVRGDLIRPLFSHRARFEVESHMRFVGRDHIFVLVLPGRMFH